MQAERMGGDFHHRVRQARVAHVREQRLQIRSLRRGMGGAEHLVADIVSIGADEPAGMPGSL